MAKIQLAWKRTADFHIHSPDRFLFVWNSKEAEMPLPLIWTHKDGDPGPFVAGFDWYAECEGFELPGDSQCVS